MNIFEPFRTQPSPLRTAVERSPAASEPLPGSVRPQAASFSPRASGGTQRCRWASVPKWRIWLVPRPLWLATVSASEPSYRAISSMMTATASMSRPEPPYSSGTVMPMRPSSPSLRTVSKGNSPVSSHFRDWDFTSSSQKSLTICWIWRWASSS